MKYYVCYRKPQSCLKYCDFRWWAAAHSVQHANIPIGINLIKLSSDIVHKLRGTFRYALGVLGDFPVEYISKSPSQSMYLVDQHMLHIITNLKQEVGF